MQRLATLSFVLVLGVGTIFFAGCSRTPDVQARTTGDVPPVAVARVKSTNLSRSLVLTAEFKPYQEIDVMAKVAGYVKQINVDIGDRVNAGQLLATLEIPEMADDRRKAQATLQRSDAQVRRANDELRRSKAAEEMAHLYYERLLKVNQERPGLVAQQEVDDAHSKDLVAEAQVAAAKSAVDAANEEVGVSKAELAKINTLFDYTKVTAPFTGVITKRYADTGSMIQAGTASQTQAMPLVRLSQNGKLRLILPVPEANVPGIHLGQQVEVKVPSLNRSFVGKVVRFADKLSLQTRTMDTEVDVENPTLVLVPGMYAEVNVQLTRRNGVLAIPITAVDADSEENDAAAHAGSGRVMVITPNNHVESRKVSLGLETATDVEVLSGLNEGDMVVIGGRSALQVGEEVKPKLTTLAESK